MINTKFNNLRDSSGGGICNAISIWKLVFSLMICSLHYWYDSPYIYTKGWYIAVEFFFIVSGYLIALKIDNGRYVSGIRWVADNVIRIFPYYIFSFFLLFIIKCVKNPSIKNIFESIPELLIMQMAGYSKNYINGPAWYISAWLICGYFIVEVANRNRWLMEKIFAPGMPLILYPLILNENGNFDVWWDYYCFMPYGLIRGFAGLCLGYLIYGMGKIQNRKRNVDFCNLFWGKIIEVVLMLVAIIWSAYIPYTRNDYIITLLIASGVFLSFSNKWEVNNGFIKKLCTLSFPIYLSHMFILAIFRFFIKNIYHIVVFFCFLLITIVWSALSYSIILYIHRNLKNIRTLKNKYR